MSFKIELDLSDDPRFFGDAISLAWSELQFHTEICEEPEHQQDCSAALDLLTELQSKLGVHE